MTGELAKPGAERPSGMDGKRDHGRQRFRAPTGAAGGIPVRPGFHPDGRRRPPVPAGDPINVRPHRPPPNRPASGRFAKNVAAGR